MPSKNKAGCGCCDGGGTVTTSCSACCPSGEFPAELTVTMTGLSGTDLQCDNCAAIPTEYVCTYIGDTLATCTWQYLQNDFCIGPCSGNTYTLTCSLTINKATCLVQVEWRLTHAGVPPACDLSASAAQWDSGSDVALCSPGDLTLDLVFEGTDTADDPCEVTYPATITVTF